MKENPVWANDKIKLLKKRYKEDGPKIIAKELGLTEAAVKLKASRLGFSRKQNEPFDWNEERMIALKSRYMTEGGAVLARELGCRVGTIYKKATELGMHTTAGKILGSQLKSLGNKSCDYKYFDLWSPKMSYILGFLFADGSVNQDMVNVTIALSSKDEQVLRFMKKELKATSPFYIQKSKHDKEGLHNQATHLYLRSKLLVKRLMELGMKPRKTYNNDPFPSIPDDMLPHFIRGYFDGDGWACLPRSGGCRIGIIGTVNMMTGIKEALVRLAGMLDIPLWTEQHKTATCARICWSKRSDIQVFYNFIYPEGYDFCLERKRKIMKDWLETEPTIATNRFKRWTVNEIKMVRDKYHLVGPAKLAKLLGRSLEALDYKKRQLGLVPIQ